MKRVVCGFLAVLVLAGCGRSSTSGQAMSGQANSPPRYESGRDVRDALVRSGLGCDDFQPVSRQQRGFGEDGAVESDTCRVANEDVSISIWSGLGQEQDWVRSRARLGCEFAEALGSAPPIYVDGGRWTVRVGSQMMAERIAQGIGGQVRSTDCRSVD